jgi:TolB-like protein/tetratricopeptide (TPR) repeat protein
VAHVFLSYKREDVARVRKLVAALRSAGLELWWDEDIPPSAPWESTIEKALADAAAVIVCWSPASVASENVRSEARVAREDGRLIQVFVKPCAPPLFFGERQGVDLSKWRGNADDPRIARIAECVREVAKTEVGTAAPEAGGRQPLPRRLQRFPMLAILAALVLLAAVGGLVAWRRAVAQPTPELAVLPFEDLSPTHDKAFFAQGVAEEIQSTLARQKGMKVLGRTSATEIERNPDPRAVRASLGVTHLLEGSTRTAGNDLRVNVRLIDTRDGSEVWEEEYRGGLADIFSVQDRIAQAVAERLRGTLFGARVDAAPTTAIDAYETYLAARALIHQGEPGPMRRAWVMARQLVEAHPDYAPGQALFAEATSLLAEGTYGYGNIPPAKAQPIILAHAREAIRLAPDRAEGYAAVGPALPWQDRVAVYQKALALDPSRADVRNRLGIAFNVLRRNDEAFEQYRLDVDTDPLSSAAINRYAQVLAASGKADEAMKVIDDYAARGGSQSEAWRFRGNTYRYLGDEVRHVAARRRALQLNPGVPYQDEWLVDALHLLGLGAQVAEYRPKVSLYYRLFSSDDKAGVARQIAADGPLAWNTNGLDAAIFSLARDRDWAGIARFYDVRPAADRDVCIKAPGFSSFLILALQHEGRSAEARKLLECTQEQVTRQLKQQYRNPDDAPGELEEMQASLLAIRGDRTSLDWLAKAVDRHWLGQYFSADLNDWPQFDSLHGDPRYTALRQRILATIARQRAEVLAGWH